MNELICISVSATELNRRRTSEHCLVDSGNDEAVERIPKVRQRTLKMTAVLGKACSLKNNVLIVKYLFI